VIRIIGVWHAFQLEGYYCSDWNHWINAEYGLTGPDVWKPFYEYLSVEAERIDADLLAEEMNEEELALYADHGARDSVARRVALEQQRKHLFINPDRRDRERLGITKEQIRQERNGQAALTDEQYEEICRQEFARRENRWLQHLQSVSFHYCICIIGSKHIPTFPSLLSANRMDHSILVANFTPKWFASLPSSGSII
jgi:hypothetical protein